MVRKSVLLKDVADVTVGYVGPMAAEYRDGGVPFLRSLNVRPHRIDLADLKYVDRAFHAKLAKSALRPGDVVTVRTGKPGQTAVVPDWLAEANCSDLVVTRPGPALDARWLSYHLNWITDTHIAGHLVGAVQQHFNVRSAEAIQLDLPPRAEQEAIAEVLGALDDKIAANVRVVTACDGYLEAVFTRLIAGAGLTTLDTLARVNQETVRPQDAGPLRYLDIAAVGQGSYELPPLTDWSSAPGRARRRTRRGDTVWSTVRPNRRAHALVMDDHEELVASTGLAVMTARAGRTAGLFEATKLPAFTDYLLSVAEGSAYPAVRGDAFVDAPVPDLDETEWDEFEAQALPLRDATHALVVENRALARTRDELLPLLMSGKLRVRDAERVVGEVV